MSFYSDIFLLAFSLPKMIYKLLYITLHFYCVTFL
nr:MAG TPA: hypothetical protein [Caudoviricetes sp.]